GRTADALTDVYGVGGLLYEMLTGAAPCVGEDAIDVLQRKANEDPKPIGQVRPNLPRDVQNLVNRALSRNPAGRHPNMTALKENILACLAAAEGAPAPLRLPASGLSTPRLPAGAVETGRTLHGHLLRVQLRPSIIVVAAALGAIALLTVRFTRQTSVAEAARTAAPATAVAVVPAAAPHRTVAAAGRPAKKAAPASTATPTATTTRIPGPGADPATLLSRGQIAFDRGDYKEAIHRGREAIAAGAVVGGRLLIGDAYLQLERYQEAVQEYDAALALDPGDSSARRRRELALEKAAR
ncbi:MAG: tetratricopeptide repeat protein, partial [Pseudomonadota bacterium]